VSVENASILHAATQGKCSLTELLSLKAIRARKSAPAKARKRTAAPKVKREPRESKTAMRKRIAELEQQLAAAERERDCA
jgi:hypothetical protein